MTKSNLYYAYEKLHLNDLKIIYEKSGIKMEYLDVSKKNHGLEKKILVIVTPVVDLKLSEFLISLSKSNKIFIFLTSNGYDKSYLSKILKKKNIVISNTKSNSSAVAEYAIALIFESLKKISDHNYNLKLKGLWSRYGSNTFDPPIRLQGKKIALYGYGDIARNIHKLLKPFKIRFGVHYNQKLKSKKVPIDLLKFENKNKLAAWADCHISCLPYNKSTKNYFGKVFFKNIKKSIFINISRGSVVDINELINAYSDNRLIHYATDVFSEYPKDWKGKTNEINKLNKISCTLSPHRAGYIYNELPHIKDIIYNIDKIKKNKFEEIKNVINK